MSFALISSPSTGHREIDIQHAELDRLVDKALTLCSEANNSAATWTPTPNWPNCWRNTAHDPLPSHGRFIVFK